MDTGGDSGSEEDEGLSLKGNGKKKISDDDDATSCRLMLFVH